MSGGAKKRSLYKYFAEYKILNAKPTVDLEVAAQRAREQLEARRGSRQPSIAVSYR